jgi:cytochrome c oxidase assembly factor CtaG
VSDAVRDIFADWSLPIWLTSLTVLTALIYIRGWVALRRTRKEQFSDMRLICFLAGLAVLWFAVASPMDGFADALLSAHMIEHLLIMSVVPPLLLLGLPAVPMLRGLPKPIIRWIVAPLIRRKPVRGFFHWIITPVVAWLAMNITFLGWHVPAAYDFALEHENWHAVEHICFLSTSILFWWVILRPWPTESRKQTWGILIYLVSADVVNTLLSAFLAFCDRPVYSYYLTHPNPFQTPPLDDQVLGAVIMWVLGSMFFLLPAVLLTLRLIGGGRKSISL